MYKLDNELFLRFPSEMIVENLKTALDFTVRHDIRISNQEVFTEHE